jgi:FixJ family two-component response regulator
MTGHGDIAMSAKAMKAGAVDFLEKPFRHQEMLDAALAIERDRKRREQQKTPSELQVRFESLTSREREVIGFVATGLMTNRPRAKRGHRNYREDPPCSYHAKDAGQRSLAVLVRMAEALGVGGERPVR